MFLATLNLSFLQEQLMLWPRAGSWPRLLPSFASHLGSFFQFFWDKFCHCYGDLLGRVFPMELVTGCQTTQYCQVLQ